MYHKKVPLYYMLRTCYLSLPKVPAEELFVNMVRNMNTDTHQYRGGAPFVMKIVSISAEIAICYRI